MSFGEYLKERLIHQVKKILLIILILLISLTISAYSATLTVNSLNGFDNIQEAINSASEGDEILVYPGTYYENIVVDKRLDLIGLKNPVIDAGDDYAKGPGVTILADGILMEGFTIRNSTNTAGDPLSGAGVLVRSNNNTIKGNILENNYRSGIKVLNGYNNSIINNSIYSNFEGILVSDSDRNKIESNRINNNSGTAIFIMHSSEQNLVIDNIINNNSQGVLLIDTGFNDVNKNNFFNNQIKNAINKYFEFEPKFGKESSETLQVTSDWIELGLPDQYKFPDPISANSNNQRAELTTKRQGYIGLYHPFKGNVYAGTGINEDDDLYRAYLFGVNGIINDLSYGEYHFKENIEKHCQEFDTNLVYGIIRPPSERGVVNNPNDTKLWEPASSPGMIQAAARFSKLSSIFPQIRGVIIDDFWANYNVNAITLDDMKNIKGALFGKKMKPDGTVDLESHPTTPNLQMFVVTYERETSSHDKNIIDMIDGVNFWIYDQENSFNNFDRYLNTLMANYPNKELITGVYIRNGDYGDMSNRSISYLIDKGIQLHEKGLSSGIFLFSGYWLVKNYISQERSQQIGLSDIFFNKYYPYLGEINCQVVDDETSQQLQGVKIKISSNMAEKIIAAEKTTNEKGMFRFSGCAGKSEGVSYSFIAEKDGYDPYNGSFTLEANKAINLPSIKLKRSERKAQARKQEELCKVELIASDIRERHVLRLKEIDARIHAVHRM